MDEIAKMEKALADAKASAGTSKGTFSYRKDLPKNAPKPQTSIVSNLADGTHVFEVSAVGPTAVRGGVGGDRDGARLRIGKGDYWIGVDCLRFHAGDDILPTGTLVIQGGMVRSLTYNG